MLNVLNVDNFESEVKEGLVLVDFYSTTCPPCMRLLPELEKLAEELETVKICKVDAVANAPLSQKFRIAMVPQVFIFKNGEVVDQFTGYKNKEDIIEILNKHM